MNENDYEAWQGRKSFNHFFNKLEINIPLIDEQKMQEAIEEMLWKTWTESRKAFMGYDAVSPYSN